jgi:hypothetical protein
MPRQTMVILRGNSAGVGSYPDEQGKTPAWPIGALHEWAASEFARRKGYRSVVLPIPGQPQSQTSPQANAAVKKFNEDPSVTAFYGFSGGGYNMRHILDRLAVQQPDSLHRIDLIVILGAPKQPKSAYEAARYDAIAKRIARTATWQPLSWEVIYRTDPPKSALPSYLPKDTDTHMFGPEALLAETPAGRYRDWPFDDEC